ncbi:MAG: class I SAM-dependent methyltransferase [Candidatus Dormibacteria bacterium]
MQNKSPLGPSYVHPRAGRVGDHTCGLEIANESSPNYHRWITQLCRPFVGNHALEIGAGYGAVTTFLANGVADYVATDTSPECLAALELRFQEMPNVSVRKLDILYDQPEGAFDSIIMINVLEHLLHDSEVLNTLSGHLAPAGKLIVYVPALNSLYGDWDDTIGHFRRYSKRQLEHVLLAAGLTIVESRYVNLVGIPAWFAFSRLGIRKKQSAREAGIGRELRIWDKTAIPVTRWLETRVRPPLGLNVLGVASNGRDTRRGLTVRSVHRHTGQKVGAPS